LSSEGILRAGVGQGEVIEKDDVEASGRIGKQKRETGVAVACLSSLALL
jgi:hypothetical protein